MKHDTYFPSKSSFTSVAKESNLITQRIISNSRLLKLMYYMDRDWEKQPDLTSEQIASLFDNHYISTVPKLKIDKERHTYLRITRGPFSRNSTNPHYRDYVVSIKIVCHFEDWLLDEYELRPYKIAGEIDSLLDDTSLVGIGKLEFIDSDEDVYDDEYGGVTLRYLAVHGNDDKIS